jgi:TolB-like protein/Tfp pilus assembly protein PilF
MPFANLSGDPEQDYFADGMVEEIVMSLARFKSIFVIGSGSTLSLKGKAISPQDVGRMFGVRYVLEGSVRKAGDRVRISIKLSETDGGSQVFVERFEDTLQDVFALQDEVSLRVAGQIEPTLEVAEFRRASGRPTESLGSYELFLRAWALERTFVKANVFAALDLLNRAIALDPNYAPALALAAICHRVIFNFRWSDDLEAVRRQGLEFADRALKTGSDDAHVLANVASVLPYLGADPWEAAALLDRAIELNPGSATVWFYSGNCRLQVGQTDLGLEHLETALRLDPVGPTRPNLVGFLGQGRFQQGRFAEATMLQRELLQVIESPRGYGFLAASLGQLGRIDEAVDALARYRALTPQPIDDLARTHLKDPAHLKLFMDGIARSERVCGPGE